MSSTALELAGSSLDVALSCVGHTEELDHSGVSRISLELRFRTGCQNIHLCVLL